MAGGAKRGDSGYGEQIVDYASHPYSFKMNCEYFQALASTFEKRYGVEFQGLDAGPTTSEPERLIQFKTNMDVIMSVLEKKKGLRRWIAEQLLDSAGNSTAAWRYPSPPMSIPSATGA